MEYQGVINLIDDSKSTESPLFSTADEMHPLGEECLTTHDVAMHFHPYLTIIIDDVELININSANSKFLSPQINYKRRKFNSFY